MSNWLIFDRRPDGSYASRDGAYEVVRDEQRQDDEGWVGLHQGAEVVRADLSTLVMYELGKYADKAAGR